MLAGAKLPPDVLHVGAKPSPDVLHEGAKPLPDILPDDHPDAVQHLYDLCNENSLVAVPTYCAAA